MADEIPGLLREITALLRQYVTLTEEMATRAEKRMAEFPVPRAVPDFAATEAKYEKQAETRREEEARHRDEDLAFRGKLLAELERHNEYLRRLLDGSTP